MWFRLSEASDVSVAHAAARQKWSAYAWLRWRRSALCVSAALLMGVWLPGCSQEGIVAEGSWQADPQLVGRWEIDAPDGITTDVIELEFHADGRLTVAGTFEATAWRVRQRIDERICIDVMQVDGPASWWATMAEDGRSMQLDATPGVWLRRMASAGAQSQE
jgi:hypothetical protein